LFNASTTSTVTDGGTSKILSFTLNNYGVGSQTAKGLSLVYNKLGVTAGGKTANVTGMHIDIDDSVGNTGTVNITGLDIDCNFGNVSGTIKNIGLDVNVAGADTNYSALFSGGNVGIGQTTPIAPLHITYTGNGVGLILESLDSGVTNAPDLMLRRSSASPADDDELGVILFNGEDGAGNSTDYAYISARTTEVDNGSEEGALKFGIMDAGTSSTMARLAKPNVGEGLSGITVHAGWHTRATVASVVAATYSPDIACSGIVILMTNGSSIVTLPDVAAADVGVQFTCINTSGGTLTGKIVSADTSNTRFNGAGSYAAQDITDDQALTFLCTGANNWQIIG